MGQYTEQGYHFGLSAPQIEDILMMARNFSRPNLLHNSRLLIDQRNRSFPLTSVTDYPSINEISVTDFLIDRWHVYNKDTVCAKVNIGNNNTVIKVVTHDANGDIANLLALRQFMWTPCTSGTNILFDKDVTISILYEDGHLFTGTGHTPKWSDFNNASNGDVGTDIRVTDNGRVHIRLSCNKNNVSNAHLEAAFMFEIFGYDSGIVATKVEIGVGQTLAIRVGNKWELIDQYDYNEDLKVCQRFYMVANVAGCAACRAAGNDTKFFVNNCRLPIDKMIDMVFSPTINFAPYCADKYLHIRIMPYNGDTMKLVHHIGDIDSNGTYNAVDDYDITLRCNSNDMYVNISLYAHKNTIQTTPFTGGFLNISLTNDINANTVENDLSILNSGGFVFSAEV